MKTIFILFALAITTNSFAQGERKLNKNFTFAVTGKMDSVASYKITSRVKRSGWGEFYGALSQSLVVNGFKVIGEDYTSPHSYIIVIDYGRGFFAGKMQYFDLRGQIITANGSETIGTFGYEGRFNPDDITAAIGSKLKEIKPFVVKEQEVSIRSTIINDPVTITNNEGPVENSKEKKLVELQELFKKNLITKEEYEEGRKKIIGQ